VFGSGKLDIKDMLRAGFFLNIISAFTVTIICIFLVKNVFGLEISELPSWAI
jgi:sodium-dependent dicarboxylate transporter 2/3/5